MRKIGGWKNGRLHLFTKRIFEMWGVICLQAAKVSAMSKSKQFVSAAALGTVLGILTYLCFG